MMKRIMAIFLLLFCSTAWGQSCTYTANDLNFGSITDVPTPQVDVTTTIDVSCTGLSNPQKRVCIGLSVGTGGISINDRRLSNGSDLVAFNVYRDAARSVVWNNDSTSNPVLLDKSGGGGTGTATFTVYGRVASGTSGVPLGFYQSVMDISSQIGSSQGCSGNFINTGGAALTALLEIEPACTIAASPLSFGTVTAVGQTDASTNLSVTCTSGRSYRIALDGGDNANINNRQMSQGANTIDYQLYRNAARTDVWGETAGVDTFDGTGTGSAESITVYGRVPAQGGKATGFYQDTITATIEF